MYCTVLIHRLADSILTFLVWFDIVYLLDGSYRTGLGWLGLNSDSQTIITIVDSSVSIAGKQLRHHHNHSGPTSGLSSVSVAGKQLRHHHNHSGLSPVSVAGKQLRHHHNHSGLSSVSVAG